MRVIFLKIKLRIVSFLLSLSLLAAIIYTGFTAYANGLNVYLIAVPKPGGAGVPIKELEDINGNRAVFTCENIYDKTVKALQSNHSVVLKGTNHSYPYVMNYNLTSGGFFTKEAAENKNKVAVINEKAAFAMFGTLDAAGNMIHIDLTPYAVIGVINDKDSDNTNVFIPAACFGETAGAIASNLSLDRSLTAEHVKNELKHIGVDELKYDFIDFGLLIKIITGKAFMSLAIILLGFLTILLRKSIGAATRKLKEIDINRQRLYFKELLKTETRPIQRLVLLLPLITSIIIIGLLLIINMLEKLLLWNTTKGMLDNINYTGFTMNIAEIERCYVLSDFLFIGFAAVFVIFMMTVWE